MLFGSVRLGLVLVWLDLAWFGLVWLGLVWFGLVWLGLAWFGLVWLAWLAFKIRILVEIPKCFLSFLGPLAFRFSEYGH